MDRSERFMNAARRKPWTNPFYGMLMIASTLFVITTLGYLVGPFVEQRAIEGVGQRSALASWFDRKGVLALAVEFVAMCILAFLAVATDRNPSPVNPPGRGGP
jgi:hypothetical protein